MGASGTTSVDFGAYPGSAEITVTIGSQAGFVNTSEAEAWLLPLATADHSVDEHIAMSGRIRCIAYWLSDNNLNIVVRPEDIWPTRDMNPGFTQRDHIQNEAQLTQTNLLYGLWTIAWVWN